MDHRVRDIIICGGGTAGWMAAAYLQRAVGSSAKITLIESSDITRIGVGEATIPTLRFTMEFLGLKEEEWMPACGATFKTGVKFVNWKGDGTAFFHPFHERPEHFVNPWGAPYYPQLGEGVSLMHCWLQQKLRGETDEPFAYAVSPGPTLCDLKKSPRFQDNPKYEFPSAYHMDAGLVAGFLRKVAVGRGVNHMIDDIVDVKVDERGFIASVVTQKSGPQTADLFLDCTGFRGLLINGALKEPFISDTPTLFCDRAVAIPVPTDGKRDGINPFTTATALNSGWCWEIPLFNRRGTGYVYSSRFTTADQAEAELREHLGPASDGMPPNHIKIRTGQNQRMWVGNCVSVGLSSCFLEPLESTGIFLIEFELAMLTTFFPDRHFHPARSAMFNDAVRRIYEETRDFIAMHYVLSPRTDTPFWQAVKNQTVIPETLQKKLELFKTQFPVLDGFDYAVFRGRNYASILAGMGHIPEMPYPLLEHVDDRWGKKALADLKTRTQQLADALPSHYDYLERLHGGPPTPFVP